MNRFYTIYIENEDMVLYSVSGSFSTEQMSDLVNDVKKLTPVEETLTGKKDKL